MSTVQFNARRILTLCRLRCKTPAGSYGSAKIRRPRSLKTTSESSDSFRVELKLVKILARSCSAIRQAIGASLYPNPGCVARTLLKLLFFGRFSGLSMEVSGILCQRMMQALLDQDSMLESEPMSAQNLDSAPRPLAHPSWVNPSSGRLVPTDGARARKGPTNNTRITRSQFDNDFATL